MMLRHNLLCYDKSVVYLGLLIKVGVPRAFSTKAVIMTDGSLTCLNSGESKRGQFSRVFASFKRVMPTMVVGITHSYT